MSYSIFDKYLLKDLIVKVVDNRGKTPLTSPVKTDEFCIPLIEINSLSSTNKFPDITLVKKYVNKNTYETWFRSGHPQHGDILVPTVGTIGLVSMMNSKVACIAQNLIGLRLDKNIVTQEYAFYYMRSTTFTKQLFNLDIGGVQPSIKVPHLLNSEIIVPQLSTQKHITEILSSLDDKIELNNKINKNLEELAQSLYIRWFVDFEFPNENGEPYKSSGGEMVDSELGMIPKGWEVKTVGDICSTVLGGTPSRSNNEYWNGNINWINSGEVNKLRIISASEKITWLGLNNSSTKLMPKKTTVIAITGATLGAVSLLEIESCANQSVIGIYESEDYPYTYVYGLIINKIKDIIGRQTGGAQQHINKNDVNSFKIVVPVKSLIMSFHKNTDAFHKIIATNMFANVNLSKIRDELLPKLMSGEIEVLVEE